MDKANFSNFPVISDLGGLRSRVGRDGSIFLADFDNLDSISFFYCFNCVYLVYVCVCVYDCLSAF